MYQFIKGVSIGAKGGQNKQPTNSEQLYSSNPNNIVAPHKFENNVSKSLKN